MKKYRALIKDIFKEISKTRNRFLSIMLIVMLGTGFFAGVKSTCPDMLDTAQRYFTENNLMDFNIKSSMGFSENDIEALKNRENVKNVYAGYTADLFSSTSLKEGMITRLYSIDLDNLDGEDTINRLDLLDGRMPANDSECVIETSGIAASDIRIGDTITFYQEDGKDVSKTLKNTEFTITGFVRSPMYINFEHGKTTIGNGNVSNSAYISQDAFAYEAITDVFITYEDLGNIEFHKDEYDDLRLEKTKELETFGNGREKTRKDEIYDKALEEIEKAERELNDGIAEYEIGKAEFDSEIAKAQNDLQNAKNKIENGKKELEANTKKINEGWIEYYKGLGALEQSEKQLIAFTSMFDETMAKFEEGLAVIERIRDLLNEIESAIPPIQSDIDEERLKELIEQSKIFDIDNIIDFSGDLGRLPQLEPGIERQLLLEKLKSILDEYEENYKKGMEELYHKRDQLENSLGQVSSGYTQLNDARRQLESGQRQIESAQKQLAQGEKDYEEGLEEFEKRKAEGEEQLLDAKAEIDEGKQKILDARHELSEMGDPEWYIFDRTDNSGYSAFSEDAERVDRIARVFPVFFIIVAALVCLTTMTRMVEEQRTQIGTLKSLGYGKGAAVAKYFLYAVSASTIGSVLGLIVGFAVIPYVIFAAYRIMYVLPDIMLVFRWDYAIGCTLVAVAVTGIAALSACAVELKEVPAQLLRPKPPKTGKRIFLERVGFIWNRLSFLQKVSARNIFRYKKRIYMTVIGVAGCTALMFAGFGLKYSISSIVEKQYDEIFMYDLIGMHKDGLSQFEIEEIDKQLTENEYISEHQLVRQETLSFEKGRKKQDAYLLVLDDMDSFSDYVVLRDRRSKDEFALSQDGVVINEKLASLLEAKKGDSIIMQDKNGRDIEITITDITENYVMNYVYMSRQLYEKTLGDYKSNAFLVKLDGECDNDKLSTSLLSNNNILGMSYSEEGGKKFRDIVGSLNYIVLVLIICAGALAFVVLYNLANINVEERIREIATIKVLGFYDNEVSSYVSRESFISSMMGMLAGLLVGIPFLKFIIATAEVDVVMFNPKMRWDSFVFASVLTMLFTVIVDRVMYKRLKKVDMVSSLKSVE